MLWLASSEPHLQLWLEDEVPHSAAERVRPDSSALSVWGKHIEVYARKQMFCVKERLIHPVWKTEELLPYTVTVACLGMLNSSTPFSKEV